MSDATAAQYRRFFDYEKDAHAKTLASLENAPPEARSKPEWQKAVDLVAHVAAARLIWLHRFGVAEERPAEFFPAGLPLADVKRRLEEVQARWDAYLARLDDAELGRSFEYNAWEGPRFRSRVDDILTQLFGHSWYHRGQIAMLLRQAGAQPAVTDFVFWSREPLETRHFQVT